MSAAMVTSFFSDYGANVVYGKNGGNFAASRPQQMLESPRRHSSSVVAAGGHGMHHVAPPLRRSTSSVTPVVLRTTSPKPPSCPQQAGSRMVPSSAVNGNMVSAVGALVGAAARAADHRKLDRSYSEPADRRASLAGPPSPTGAAPPTSPPSVAAAQNSSRYKTELCRPFEESGTCKYGDKCQFAHGGHELRTLARHPKYKTELCRTFHTTGFCPYGPRCHFIHNSDESRKSLLNNINSQAQRPKALSVGSFGSLGSAGDLSPPSSPLYDDPFYAPSSNTAFSFSQDFAALVAANKGHPGYGFGGSQPALAAALSPFSALSLPESAFPFPALAAQQRVVEGPPSPVDSLGSELDSMSVSASSPASCGSPLTRLPIFNRLANARDSD
ncbi:mRNA decay activator protein ZFP36L1-like isoform X1 [Dermacentor albipictus]|uniref:mRNA decay activator protein ZFP36L1-like isoform X1 n=2 Tax=Dermacentor albipictus TaxID=60249 RepID=UPI0031FC2216